MLDLWTFFAVKSIPDGLDRLSVKGNDGEQLSLLNMNTIRERLGVLLFVRSKIHNYVTEQKRRTISPYEWLLLQLYPIYFFGHDIFAEVSKMVIIGQQDIDLRQWGSALYLEMDSLGRDVVPFIDEAQELLKEGKDLFLTSDGSESRSMYYAILRALTYMSNFTCLGSPILSGTGLSIDDLQSQSASGGAGKASVSKGRLYFSGFQTLDNAAVKMYIRSFLHVDEGVKDDVIDHMAKWLRGRPRWTASFIETFLGPRRKRKNTFMTRGNFVTDSENILIEAIDRYIDVMTNDHESNDARFSFSFGHTSAWGCMSRAMAKDVDLSRKLENAVFDYAIGKAPTFLQPEVKTLIEYGVAAVAGHKLPNRNCYSGILAEPLIVQAGLNMFRVEDYLKERMTQQDDHGGATFEKSDYSVITEQRESFMFA